MLCSRIIDYFAILKVISVVSFSPSYLFFFFLFLMSYWDLCKCIAYYIGWYFETLTNHLFDGPRPLLYVPFNYALKGLFYPKYAKCFMTLLDRTYIYYFLVLTLPAIASIKLHWGSIARSPWTWHISSWSKLLVPYYPQLILVIFAYHDSMYVTGWFSKSGTLGFT